MKFRTRLFFLYLLTVGLMTIVLAAYLINFEEERIRGTLHEELLIQAKLIGYTLSGTSLISEDLADLVRRDARETGARVTVINLTGVVLADSAEDYRKMVNHRNRPEIQAALDDGEGYALRYSKTLRKNLIYVAYPIKQKQQIIGVIRLSRSQEQLNQSLFRVRWLIIGGILTAAFLAVLFGRFALNKITSPILELQRVAIRITNGDLSEKVRFYGHDELADLGLSLNSMTRQLSDSFTMISEEKQKLEVIMDNLTDGILVVDSNLEVILSNPAAIAIFGLKTKNIYQRPILELLINHHLLELIQEVVRTHQPLESELILHYPRERQLQVSLVPLQDEAKQLRGTIMVFHDLTKIRYLERVRQDFVANVSHELRTPITTIKVMAETLTRGGWQETELLKRYLGAIDQECDRLANLINDLLALAKLDSKIEVPTEQFTLYNLVQEVVERFEIADSLIKIVIDLPELPMVNANRNQIKQVLINLIDNAVKYNHPNGSVRIEASCEGENWVRVMVKDTGMGITTTDLKRIFERFYRVDKAHSRQIGGTGLGLSIVKHIVEGYGGKIEVESEVGQGSTFSFTISVC